MEYFNQNNDLDSKRTQVDINSKNEKEYAQIIQNSKQNKDMFFDKNSILTKIVLVFLGGIIIFGTIYYLLMFLNN